MTINEMKQTIALCAATLKRLNGTAPGMKELCSALGEEHAILINEYLHDQRIAAAA